MSEVVKRFKDLGFTHHKSKNSMVFIKEMSRYTMLIVEGDVKKGYSEFRFNFYKQIYRWDGGKEEKIYLQNASVIAVLRRVKSYLRFIENRTRVR